MRNKFTYFCKIENLQWESCEACFCGGTPIRVGGAKCFFRQGKKGAAGGWEAAFRRGPHNLWGFAEYHSA